MTDGWMLRVTHAAQGGNGFREIYAWIEDAGEAEAAVRAQEALAPDDHVTAVRTISDTAFETMGFAPGQVGEFMGAPPAG